MTEADKILNKNLTDDEAKYIADKRFLYDSLINAINEALAISRVVGQSEQFYCFNEKNKRIDRCENQCGTCKKMKLMQ